MLIGIATGIGGKLVGGAIVEAIKVLYGMGTAINVFVDDHIEQMKKSDNQTVSRTGNVLESAKLGFGLGYMTSVIVIATGQHLLGNTLSAMGTLATATTFTNPIAMTCAAVGAIYYGWSALSESDRAEIINNLVKGLDVGSELILAVLKFVTSKIKLLLSSENISDFKNFIASCSERFGKSLYDVTGKMSDLARGAADRAFEYASLAAESTSTTVRLAGVAVGGAAAKAAGATSVAVKGAREASKEAASASHLAMKEALNVTGNAASKAVSATSSVLKESFDIAGGAVNGLSSSAKQALGIAKGKQVLQSLPGKLSND